MNFLEQLKHRKVIRAAVIYAGGAWLTTEIVRFLLEQFGAPYWTDTALAIALVIGFPIAMWLAWTFDLSVQGIHRTRSEASTGKATIAISVFFLAAATAGLYFLVNPPEHQTTISVFPFQTLNPDAQSVPYGLGVTAELVSRLSHMQNLQVATYHQPRRTTEALGHAIETRYILEGTVRVIDDRIRVIPVLVDNRSGYTIWSADFDGDLAELLQFEEATALRIADVLNIRLSKEEKDKVNRRYTSNPDAYDAFLRGWSLLETFHASFENPGPKLENSREHLMRALDLDSEYSIALAGLSIIDGYKVYFGIGDRDENLQRANEFAERSLDLDSEAWEAHFAMASFHDYAGNTERAIEAYYDAIGLNPKNASVWCFLSGALSGRQPPDAIEAEKAARQSIEISPGYFLAYSMLGWALRDQGRLEEALSAHEYALQLYPGSTGGHIDAGMLYMDTGDYAAALTHFEKSGRSPFDLFRIAQAQAALGNPDEALDTLEQALVGGFKDIGRIESSPYLVSLADDARFQELINHYRELPE